MGEVFVALIDYLPLLLLVLAYLTGRFVERRHYRSIKRRENKTLSQALITSEGFATDRVVRSAELAVGSVVVSVDYFKRALGAFR
ncbi:MAG: YbjQ family protein, partial [Planctomycetes bacterium]|nr:YbjQ family protein [Planctomycetota bacterium]